MPKGPNPPKLFHSKVTNEADSLAAELRTLLPDGGTTSWQASKLDEAGVQVGISSMNLIHRGALVFSYKSVGEGLYSLQARKIGSS